MAIINGKVVSAEKADSGLRGTYAKYAKYGVPEGYRRMVDGETIPKGFKFLSSATLKFDDAIPMHAAIGTAWDSDGVWMPFFVKQSVSKYDAAVVLPEGWHEVDRGEVIKEGDRFSVGGGEFAACRTSIGYTINIMIVIRRDKEDQKCLN
jgi:hypothetical protein